MKILIIFLICLFPVSVWAASTCNTTVTCDSAYNPGYLGFTPVCRQPDSLSLGDVQACVTASTASDGNHYGDGVYLQTGSITWSTTYLDLTGKHGIVIKGNGTSNTVITLGGTNNLLAYAPTVQRARITGTHFVLIPSTQGAFQVSNGTNFRFDNNLVTGSGTMTSYTLLFSGANPSGLVDSNAFTLDFGNYGLIYFDPNDTFITSRVDFTSFTSGWVIAEGNTINATSSNGGCELIENNDGGKILTRYNTINDLSGGSTFYEQHNRGQGWGGRTQVHYNNKIVLTVGGYQRLLYARAGTGLIYNNVIDYTTRVTEPTYFQLRAYRAAGGQNHDDLNNADEAEDCANYSTNTADYTGGGFNFTGTMLSKCCSSSYSGSGLTGEGYPCVGQPGTGVWGTDTIPEPWYFWHNQKTGNSGSSYQDITTLRVSASEQWAVAVNREYCITSSATQPTSCGTATLTYIPPSCPHTLTGLAANCNSSVAGVLGYNPTIAGSTSPLSGATIKGGKPYQ